MFLKNISIKASEMKLFVFKVQLKIRFSISVSITKKLFIVFWYHENKSFMGTSEQCISGIRK